MAQRTVRFSTKLTAISPATVPDPPTSTSLDSTDSRESTPSPPSTILTPTVEGDEIILKIEDVHDVLKLKSHPNLTFDVWKDPAYTQVLSEELAEDIRGEPATTPAVPYVKLVSRYLPWEIEIRSSSSPEDENAFVSVADILGGLYCALQIQVTDSEFRECEKREAVTKAFEERCRLVGGVHGDEAAESERRNGIRRVDFLQGNLRFCGLTPHKPNYRQLRFSVMQVTLR